MNMRFSDQIRLGVDFDTAQAKFFVPSLTQRGMMVQHESRFYLCLGSTPGIMYEAWTPNIEILTASF